MALMDGGERLAISLDFVAYYSPGAGRNLAAGFMVAAAAAEATRGRRLGLFFFSPSFECHLSVWPTNAPRWRLLSRLPGASRVPELRGFTFAPSHPLHPQPGFPSFFAPHLSTPPTPQHRKKPPSSLS